MGAKQNGIAGLLLKAVGRAHTVGQDNGNQLAPHAD
jgi:hypothetical protein